MNTLFGVSKRLPHMRTNTLFLLLISRGQCEGSKLGMQLRWWSARLACERHGDHTPHHQLFGRFWISQILIPKVKGLIKNLGEKKN